MKAPGAVTPIDPAFGVCMQPEVGHYLRRGGSTRRLPGFRDLVFVPRPLRLPTHPREVNTAVRLGGQNTARPLELAIPILIAPISFEALSKPARIALAQGSRLADTAIYVGGGRMLPEERHTANHLIFQYFPGHYGWHSQDLLQAEALELILSQRAEIDGYLTNDKTINGNDLIRELPEDIDRHSPNPHQDIFGADHLTSIIAEFRETTDWQVPISLKMTMGRVTEDIRLAIDVKADIIRLDGMEWATGAPPEKVREHIGLPTVCSLAEARRALAENDWADRLDIVVSGGIRDGADVAKALALGAKAVHVGLGALMAMGCTGCRTCFTGDCPQGIATQNPELMKKLDIEAATQGVYNYLTSLNEEIKLICAVLGKSDIAELGADDLEATTIEASAMTGLPLVGTGKVF
jgi:methylamine---glutamate N-methyltransferase subunit C